MEDQEELNVLRDFYLEVQDAIRSEAVGKVAYLRIKKALQVVQLAREEGERE